MTHDSQRAVSCELAFDVTEPGEIIFQVAVADSVGTVLVEKFDAHLDEAPTAPAHQLIGPHGTRIHVLQTKTGRFTVEYRAEIDVVGAPRTEELSRSSDSSDAFEQIMYERPSRYCPSDHLVGFAQSEFGTDAESPARAEAITEWIRRRIAYVSGASTVHSSAEDTVLTGQGTCRDFAHLGIALCRAVGIAARFTSVYAPGLSPMDFHAVFEALHDGRWYVYDATGLAPRSSMVRIATGRDAADAAFATVTRGAADLTQMMVTATVGSSLPRDDLCSAVELA